MAGPLLSAATLDRLRALDESAMPSRCRVLRRTATTAGGRVKPGDPAPIGATVDCRLAPSGLQPSEGEMVGRVADLTHGTVALPLGIDVRSGDWIEVATALATTTFEVVGDPWAASYGTHLDAVVRREG